MQKITTEADLRMAILRLEMQQTAEGILLKEQFLIAYESVKPVNLIKNTLMEAAKSSDIQNSLLNSSFGILVGYLSKALFMGATGGPIRKILGNVIMFGIKNIVTNNPAALNSVGSGIFSSIKNLWSQKDVAAEETNKQTT
jgi:hypothetical protein